MKQIYDAIIVGAGLAGLSVAARLRTQNKKFIILEKSGGVGGRLATRRDQDCTFYHGAQFIKLNTEAVPPWCELINYDHLGVTWFSEGPIKHMTFPGGMTSFAKTWPLQS